VFFVCVLFVVLEVVSAILSSGLIYVSLAAVEFWLSLVT
jgi:hypothetical protein